MFKLQNNLTVTQCDNYYFNYSNNNNTENENDIYTHKQK